MKFLNNAYKKIGKTLVRELKKELKDQGHVATGNLLNSIRAEDNKKGQLVIRALPRWKDVNDGQPKGTDVNELKLKRWFTAKGIDWRKDPFIIYQVNKAIYEEGTPTAGSFRYSKNGRRTGFVDQVMDRNRISITKETKNAVILDWRKEINKGIEKIVSKSRNLKRR